MILKLRSRIESENKIYNKKSIFEMHGNEKEKYPRPVES